MSGSKKARRVRRDVAAMTRDELMAENERMDAASRRIGNCCGAFGVLLVLSVILTYAFGMVSNDAAGLAMAWVSVASGLAAFVSAVSWLAYELLFHRHWDIQS